MIKSAPSFWALITFYVNLQIPLLTSSIILEDESLFFIYVSPYSEHKCSLDGNVIWPNMIWPYGMNPKLDKVY